MINCQAVEEWVKRMDLFGRPITLNFKGSSVYRTVFGGGMTVLTAVLMVFFFFSSIQAFLTKGKIKNQQSKVFYDDPPQFILNSNNFMFALSIQQTDFLTNPYYDIKLIHRNDTRDANGVYVRREIPLPLEKCTLKHWENLPQDYDWNSKFVSMNFSNFLCPQLNYTMALSGVFASSEFSYYKVVVQPCVSDPSINKICRTDLETTTILDKNDGAMRVLFYQSQLLFNPDKSSPMASYLSDQIQYLFSPGKIFITANLFYSSLALDIDEEIFVGTNLKKEVLPIFSAEETTTQFTAGKKTEYASIYLRKSLFESSAQRSYQKIADLLSYIGGFVQSLFLVISLIIALINECLLSVELANQLYDFEFTSSQDQKKPDQSKQQTQQRNHSNSSPTNMLVFTPQAQKTNLSKNNILDVVEHKLVNLKNQPETSSTPNSNPTGDNNNNNPCYKQIQASSPHENCSKSPESYKNNQNNNINYCEDENKEQIFLESQKLKQWLNFTQANTNNHCDQVLALKQSANPLKLETLEYFPQEKHRKHSIVEKTIELMENGHESHKENTKQSHHSQPNFVLPQTKKQFLTQQFTEILLKQHKIQVTASYFLNKLFCGKYFNSEHNRLIDRAQKEISKNMDVFNMIEKVNEVEKLKYVLFEKEQQVLFDFCPKPLLKLKDDQLILKRAQLVENFQKKKQHILPQLKKNKNVSKFFNQGKLLNTTLRAVSKFRKILSKKSEPSIDTYKYLYEAYDLIEQSQENQKINKRLVISLGEEMRKIFEKSKLIEQQTNKNLPADRQKQQQLKQDLTLAKAFDLTKCTNVQLGKDNICKESPNKRILHKPQTFKEVDLSEKSSDVERTQNEGYDKDQQTQILEQRDITPTQKIRDLVQFSSEDTLSDIDEVEMKQRSNYGLQLFSTKRGTADQGNSTQFQVTQRREEKTEENMLSSPPFKKKIFQLSQLRRKSQSETRIQEKVNQSLDQQRKVIQSLDPFPPASASNLSKI